MSHQPTLPTREDDDVRRGSEVIGGPIGRYARLGSSWWNPLRVLIGLGTLAYLLGYFLDLSCRTSGWRQPEVYEHLCYSDIPPLYSLRGFADGLVPYFETMVNGQPLEYPVLTGGFIWIAAEITRAITTVFPDVSTVGAFFDVNVALLFIAFLVTIVATALTVKRRPWDAAMVALAPTMILAATINWDLLALAAVAVSLLLWARKYPTWAGVFLGLAIAAKFYPIVMLGPFLLLCWRAKQMKSFGKLFAGAAIAWLVVNVPVMLGAFDGWSYFYTFSQTRGQDFGSIYLAITNLTGYRIPDDALNNVSILILIALCLGIAILILKAPQRPRLAAMLFLVVAAFAVTNKVYSPQYVLWLVPLAVLARPKWRDFIIWQAGEVVYFIAIWWYLVGLGNDENKGMTPEWYGVAIWVHVGVTVWFAALIVRDAIYPQHDPIRSDGIPEHVDDPGGGVLDGAR